MTMVWCPIVELRQYALRPGQREVLITLFDREFVESQEELGMVILGQFRDLDNPDRFVWLRGFETMPGRAAALADFYSGPVWKANSAAANATMLDSDNVLLLRPASAPPASEHPPPEHPLSARPASEHPASEHPPSARPESAPPASEHPASEHPASEHPPSARPESAPPTSKHLSSARPASERPTSEHPTSGRPASACSGFPGGETTRPPVGHIESPGSVILATIYYRDRPFDDEFCCFFDRRARPALAEAGAAPFACLQTEYAENTFPALPVRTGEHAFVWFARFPSAAQARAYEDRLPHTDAWRDSALPELSRLVTGATERLRLSPTARSLLR